MFDVKISYNKAYGRNGTVYDTCVRMDKSLFDKFLLYINEVYMRELKKSDSKKDWNILWYIKGDIEEYLGKDIMYLRLTTTRALEDFLKLHNLNTKNRRLIFNTMIKIK